MTANIFEKAAQVISETGHAKGALRDYETGAHCAMGALNVADHGAAFYASSDRVEHLANQAAQMLADRGQLEPYGHKADYLDLIQWNNAPERTGEDVILLFKELAAEDG